MGHGQIEVIVKIKEKLIIQDKNQSNAIAKMQIWIESPAFSWIIN